MSPPPPHSASVTNIEDLFTMIKISITNPYICMDVIFHALTPTIVWLPAVLIRAWVNNYIRFSRGLSNLRW